jgi:hypothetical protein
VRRPANGMLSLALGVLPLAVTAVAACSSQAQTPVTTSPVTGLCVSEGLERFVGRSRSEQLGSEIRRQSGASALRWVPEGTMVTMEFRSERVTVHLDGSNRVKRVICG